MKLSNDGQEDDQISCFKPGKPCEASCEILNQQVKLLTDESLHIKPFFKDITDSDMEDEEIDEI